MALSSYGRLLTYNALVRTEREKPEKRTMTELTIIQHGVCFLDAGRTHRPENGAVVTVLSQSVVQSLVKSGMATEGRTSLVVEAAPRAAQRVEATAGTDGSSGDESGAGTATWNDVTGLSRSALDLLLKNARGEDPRTAPLDENFLAWMEGSIRRYSKAVAAVEKWRAGDGDG